jgi:catechol 2,3-dioxygenase-like lactoylglutathione lyase family enzyme
LEEVVRFYSKGLGLRVLTSFQEHAGYSGVILGLPGAEYQLEFTHHERGSPCPAPSQDNLLVLYVSDKKGVDQIAARLEGMGHHPVPPENPYWKKGVTFEDPDGWRLVLIGLESLTEV